MDVRDAELLEPTAGLNENDMPPPEVADGASIALSADAQHDAAENVHQPGRQPGPTWETAADIQNDDAILNNEGWLTSLRILFGSLRKNDPVIPTHFFLDGHKRKALWPGYYFDSHRGMEEAMLSHVHYEDPEVRRATYIARGAEDDGMVRQFKTLFYLVLQDLERRICKTGYHYFALGNPNSSHTALLRDRELLDTDILASETLETLMRQLEDLLSRYGSLLGSFLSVLNLPQPHPSDAIDLGLRLNLNGCLSKESDYVMRDTLDLVYINPNAKKHTLVRSLWDWWYKLITRLSSWGGRKRSRAASSTKILRMDRLEQWTKLGALVTSVVLMLIPPGLLFLLNMSDISMYVIVMAFSSLNATILIFVCRVHYVVAITILTGYVALITLGLNPRGSS